MSWLFGLGGNGGGPRPQNPLIATSGKWLARCVGLYAAIFWTPDVWTIWEDDIAEAIVARYDGTAAFALFWLLKLAAYPLVFFAVSLGLGVAFVALVMGVMTNLFRCR
ncbi:MAG: hypothetical protein AAGG09_00645 [Pseudomonadota bacterium]